jgi:hypothetical protein
MIGLSVLTAWAFKDGVWSTSEIGLDANREKSAWF